MFHNRRPGCSHHSNTIRLRTPVRCTNLLVYNARRHRPCFRRRARDLLRRYPRPVYYAHSISLLNRRRQLSSHADMIMIYPGWKSRASKRHGSSMERTGVLYTITRRRYAGWLIWDIRLGRIRKILYLYPTFSTSLHQQLGQSYPKRNHTANPPSHYLDGATRTSPPSPPPPYASK